MAGWIGLLKHVPWREVVSNAPKLAEGAKSLWGTVSKKIRPGDELPPMPQGDAASPEGVRISALEGRLRDLQVQLASTTELVGSLAEQNAQLVARLDVLQRRLRWLSGGLLLTAIGAALALIKVV